MSQYQQLYDMVKANNDNLDLDLMNEFRSMRFDDSIATNVSLFFSPRTVYITDL